MFHLCPSPITCTSLWHSSVSCWLEMLVSRLLFVGFFRMLTGMTVGFDLSSFLPSRFYFLQVVFIMLTFAVIIFLLLSSSPVLISCVFLGSGVDVLSPLWVLLVFGVVPFFRLVLSCGHQSVVSSSSSHWLIKGGVSSGRNCVLPCCTCACTTMA